MRQRFGKWLWLLLMLAQTVTAQEIIEMEPYGNLFRIPCTVNGASMKLIFDTGASDVSISVDCARYMLQNGYLENKDVLSLGKSSVADGSIVEHMNIILKDISIGSLHIKNVRASIMKGQNVPLLLGQTVIQSLGAITIDGTKLIIHKTKYTEADLQKMADDAVQQIKTANYTAAINNLLRINNIKSLTSEQLVMLAECYARQEQYKESLGVCAQWMTLYGETQSELHSRMLNLIASNFYIQEHYRDAITYWKMLADKEKDNKEISSITNWNIADAYLKMNDTDQAIVHIRDAVSTYRRVLGVSIEEIERGSVKDEMLGMMFYLYGSCLLKKNQRAGVNMMTIAAKCGDRGAIEYCRKNRVKY